METKTLGPLTKLICIQCCSNVHTNTVPIKYNVIKINIFQWLLLRTTKFKQIYYQILFLKTKKIICVCMT